MAIAVIVAMSMVHVPPRRAEAAGPLGPNILIIVTDDQRGPETLSVMPQVRRLFARAGTRYAYAFATTPLCCPSRSSIMTGQYAHNHGVHTNDDAMALDQTTAVHRALHDSGYNTAIVGKYLNKWDPARNPADFDHWAQWLSGWYYNSTYNIDGVPTSVDEYSTSFITSEAMRFLKIFESDDQRPWLMYYWPTAPHSPYTPNFRDRRARVPRPRDTPDRTDRDLSDEPSYIQASASSPARAPRVRRMQLRTLMSVDRQVGRLFNYLDGLDETRDTLAIFMSDNGFMWGEHGIVGKRYAYTGSILIPMLMRWPGHVEQGAVDTRLVANLDVAATILDAADIELGRVDGQSLLGGAARDRVLIESWVDDETPVPTWASTRTYTYQYVEYYAEDSITVLDRAYYDLIADPWQRFNLLGDEDPTNDPDVTFLSAQLAADRACKGSSCP